MVEFIVSVLIGNAIYFAVMALVGKWQDARERKRQADEEWDAKVREWEAMDCNPPD